MCGKKARFWFRIRIFNHEIIWRKYVFLPKMRIFRFCRILHPLVQFHNPANQRWNRNYIPIHSNVLVIHCTPCTQFRATIFGVISKFFLVSVRKVESFGLMIPDESNMRKTLIFPNRLNTDYAISAISPNLDTSILARSHKLGMLHKTCGNCNRPTILHCRKGPLANSGGQDSHAGVADLVVF